MKLFSENILLFSEKNLLIRHFILMIRNRRFRYFLFNLRFAYNNFLL